MYVKRVNYETVEKLEGDSPLVGIVNELETIFCRLSVTVNSSEAHMEVGCINGENFFLRKFHLDEFKSSIPEGSTWTPEQFDEYKKEWSQRKEYQNHYFCLGASAWAGAKHCLDGVFVWIDGEEDPDDPRRGRKALRLEKPTAMEVLKALLLFQQEELDEQEACLVSRKEGVAALGKLAESLPE